MTLPPGVTEESFLAAIEKVAAVLAPKFAFGPHESDDVRQLVAEFAIEALPRYEPERGGLEGFIFRHCSNRLSNKRRDELGCRTDPPCRVCHAAALGSGPGHPDGRVCPSYAKWKKRKDSRAAIARPLGLGSVADEAESRHLVAPTAESEAEGNELMARIDERLPLWLRADYLKMLADVPVPRAKRLQVQRVVAEILGDDGVLPANAAGRAGEASDVEGEQL